MSRLPVWSQRCVSVWKWEGQRMGFLTAGLRGVYGVCTDDTRVSFLKGPEAGQQVMVPSGHWFASPWPVELQGGEGVALILPGLLEAWRCGKGSVEDFGGGVRVEVCTSRDTKGGVGVLREGGLLLPDSPRLATAQSMMRWTW